MLRRISGSRSAEGNNANSPTLKSAGANGTASGDEPKYTADQQGCLDTFVGCFGAWAAGKYNQHGPENEAAYKEFFIPQEKSGENADGTPNGIFNDCSAWAASVNMNNGGPLKSGTGAEKYFQKSFGKANCQEYWIWWAATFEQGNMVPVWQPGAPGSNKVYFSMISDLTSKHTGKTAAQVPILMECTLRDINAGKGGKPQYKIQGFTAFSAGHGIQAMADILTPNPQHALNQPAGGVPVGAAAAQLEDNQQKCLNHFMATFQAWGEGKFNGDAATGKPNAETRETMDKFWLSDAAADTGKYGGPLENDMSAFGHVTKISDGKAAGSGTGYESMFINRKGTQAIMEYWVWWNQTFEQDPASIVPTINAGAVGSNKVFMHFVSDIKCKKTGKTAKAVPTVFEANMVEVGKGDFKIRKFVAYPDGEGLKDMARIMTP